MLRTPKAALFLCCKANGVKATKTEVLARNIYIITGFKEASGNFSVVKSGSWGVWLVVGSVGVLAFVLG